MSEAKRVVLAVSMFAGTIIGAGVFSLPYILSKTGIVLGITLLVVFGTLYEILYRRYSAVHHRFRTALGNHHFIYLSRKLLSAPAAHVASGTVLAELFFTLTAYIVLSASFAGLLGIPQHIAWFVFWGIGSATLFTRARMRGVFEFIGTLGIIAVGVLFMLLPGRASVPLFGTESLTFRSIVPFLGALVFMFSGRPAVPEAQKLFGRTRIPQLVLSLGVAVPLLFYVLFGVGVLHLTATPATDTVGGLTSLPPLVAPLVGILGLLALFTSYLTISDNAKDILEHDVFRKKLPAFALTMFLPILIFAFGLREFMFIIGVTGGIFLALEALFMNRMWERVFKVPPFTPASIAIYLVFGAALAAEGVLLVGFL